MVIKKVFLLALVLFIFEQAFNCTTFFINKNGQLVFGRNYDWVSDAGMLCTNLKGLRKTSIPTGNGNTTSWTSKYGSITFNQYGKEFPTGGMNEKGLVVELMWLDETVYPKPDDRASLGVLQWIQYQLDNHATIEEVIQSTRKIRIASDDPPLHYLIADASGHAATIEFLHGELKVHKGKELPFAVLANDPYDVSSELVRESQKNSGDLQIRSGNNSMERFSIACKMVNQFEKQNLNRPVVDYSFSILDEVAQGDYTKWSIVYDISNKKVFYKTQRFPQVKSVGFNALQLNCDASSVSIDMNSSGSGDISRLLKPFNTDLNRRIVNDAIDQSKSRVKITESEREKGLSYPLSISCEKK